MRVAAKLSGPETLEQSREHFLYFEKFAFGFLVSAGFEQSEIAGEEKKVLKLAGRSHGDIQELSKLGAPFSATPFRNVCWYGTGRATDLAAEAKSLIRWEFTREFIRLESQFMTPAPNLQLAEILHVLTPLGYFEPQLNYLQLTTNNCQLFGEASHVG
jgi:hypothetical protein